MLFKTLILSLCAALALACRDDPDFSWKYEFGGKRFTHYCSFLTNSVNPQQNEKRQNNWCNKRVGNNNVLIKNKCRDSCDNCDDDDKPSRGCVNKPKNFRDSEDRGCSWYGKKNTKYRCDNSKDWKYNGTYAKKACCICGGGNRDISDLYVIDTSVAKKHEDDDEDDKKKHGKYEDDDEDDKKKHGKDEDDDEDDDEEDDCKDHPKKFEDSEGNDCDWYAKKDKRCKDADDYENEDGYTAEDACCACGGGKDKKMDSELYSFKPDEDDDEDDDEDNCKDKPKNFKDSEGNGCKWYERKEKRCKDAKKYKNDDGDTAKDACCVCGGGKDKKMEVFTATA